METVVLKADATLDLCGLSCPTPLLGARRVLDDLRPGQVLALVSNCPGTRDDVFLWTRHTDHEVVHVDSSRAPRNVFYIRKGKRPVPEATVTLDMRGATCPGPVVEAKRMLNGLKSGEVLRLLSTCPAARNEVGTWSASVQHQLLETREVAAGVWEFYIRRG